MHEMMPYLCQRSIFTVHRPDQNKSHTQGSERQRPCRLGYALPFSQLHLVDEQILTCQEKELIHALKERTWHSKAPLKVSIVVHRLLTEVHSVKTFECGFKITRFVRTSLSPSLRFISVRNFCLPEYWQLSTGNDSSNFRGNFREEFIFFLIRLFRRLCYICHDVNYGSVIIGTWVEVYRTTIAAVVRDQSTYFKIENTLPLISPGRGIGNIKISSEPRYKIIYIIVSSNYNLTRFHFL